MRIVRGPWGTRATTRLLSLASVILTTLLLLSLLFPTTPSTCPFLNRPVSVPSPSSANLPYKSSLLPFKVGSPRFLFAHGDSYTETGFNIYGAAPTLCNPQGNHDFPATANTTKWLDVLIENSPSNTLAYNFAAGGGIVDTLTGNPTEGYVDIPDFTKTSTTFVSKLGSRPFSCHWNARQTSCLWNATNSIHIIWFGRNDVYWQVTQGVDMRTRLDAVISKYVKIVDTLFHAGARQFIVMGIPTIWLEPVWRMDVALFLNPNVTFAGLSPQVKTSATYWNEILQSSMMAWQESKEEVSLSWLDTWPAFHRVLDDHARWGLHSNNCHNGQDFLPADAECPFMDTLHPGPALATSVGIAVGQHLKSIGFLPAFGLDMI